MQQKIVDLHLSYAQESKIEDEEAAVYISDLQKSDKRPTFNQGERFNSYRCPQVFDIIEGWRRKIIRTRKEEA